MEAVLSDHPFLPRQTRLLCSASAAVLYRCFSLQCSKSLSQLPGWMLSGPVAVLTWSDPFHLVILVHTWGVVAVLTARVSSAASILWGACSSPFLVAIDKM